MNSSPSGPSTEPAGLTDPSRSSMAKARSMPSVDPTMTSGVPARAAAPLAPASVIPESSRPPLDAPPRASPRPNAPPAPPLLAALMSAPLAAPADVERPAPAPLHAKMATAPSENHSRAVNAGNEERMRRDSHAGSGPARGHGRVARDRAVHGVHQGRTAFERRARMLPSTHGSR